MENILEMKLSEVEYHLYIGGWKIHHILSNEIFNSKEWTGFKIYTDNEELGSHTTHTDKISTQNIEIIPATLTEMHYWKILIDGKEVVKHNRFSTEGDKFLTELRKNEGLTGFEFHNTKFDLHSRELKPFSGKIIHFNDFRYLFFINKNIELTSTLQEKIAKNIHWRRKELGIKQKELALELNIGHSQISRFEMGKHFISIPNLKAICSILKCKSSDILDF